jgi:hypothetical protein
MHSFSSIIIVGCVLSACSASHDVVDAGVAFDAADIGPTDGGSCVPEPIAVSCAYHGYGSQCPVSCSFPRTCTFSVQVTWTGAYCCGFPSDIFVDCACDGGTALCRPAFTPTPLAVPATYCEFCERDAAAP